MAHKTTFSRRRYSEAVKALKQILANQKQPAILRLRATELLLLCYGHELPGNSKRDRRSAKELVQEHNLEKRIKAGLDAKQAQTQEQEPAEELDTDDSIAALFDAVLNDDGGNDDDGTE